MSLASAPSLAGLALLLLQGVAGLQHDACLLKHTSARMPRSSVLVMARKPFKGGRLDDFLGAAEAEAKYGPGRYAAVAEDAWKIAVEQREQEEQTLLSREVYRRQKSQLLQDHAYLSVLGCAAMWSFFSASATVSYAVGAALGLLYLYLLQKQSDSVGATSIEEVSKGPPPIVVPVLMVLIVAKNRELSLLPVLAGFVTNQLATVTQLVYSENYGVTVEEVTADAKEQSTT